MSTLQQALDTPTECNGQPLPVEATMHKLIETGDSFAKSAVTIHSVITDRIDRLRPNQQLTLKVDSRPSVPAVHRSCTACTGRSLLHGACSRALNSPACACLVTGVLQAGCRAALSGTNAGTLAFPPGSSAWHGSHCQRRPLPPPPRACTHAAWLCSLPASRGNRWPA